MTLNLAQIQKQVKQANLSRAHLNPNGNYLAINEAYRQLKQLGWQCFNREVHPTDRVPVFRLTGHQADAAIRRDKSGHAEWLVEIDEQAYEVNGDLTEMTEWVRGMIEPHLTEVRFDRREKMWLAVNGKTTSFPAGPEGKREAELFALRHDCPDIADEVEAIIANAEALRVEMFDADGIAARAIKAGFILRDGKLWPGREYPEVARCQGTAPEPYRLISDGEAIHCDCIDFEFENSPVLPNGQRGCKHILAWMIGEEVA